MSSETFWHLQTALHARLCAHSPLCALLAAGAQGIYDHVPRDAAFPYIVIGAMASRPEAVADAAAQDIGLSLHVYSRGEGQREVKRIMAALSDAMQQGAMNVAGHVLVLCREVSASCGLSPDGETRHGVLQYRLIVDRAV